MFVTVAALVGLCLIREAVAFGNITGEGCGDKKSCVAHPKGCEADFKTCVGFVSWMRIHSGGSDYLQVELYTKGAPNLKAYIAVSYSNDTKMPGNPYEVCYKADSGAKLAFGELTSYLAPAMTTTAPAGKIVAEADLAYATDAKESILQCRYRRYLETGSATYNLRPGPSAYYVMGAYGTFSGSLGKHKNSFTTAGTHILNAGSTVEASAGLLVAALVTARWLP